MSEIGVSFVLLLASLLIFSELLAFPTELHSVYKGAIGSFDYVNATPIEAVP